MDDGDDLIGGILLGNASFEGSSDLKSEWSDLVMSPFRLCGAGAC